MRWLRLVTAVIAAAAGAAAARAQGGVGGAAGDVRGHVVVVERKDRPSPDVANAVVWLEGPGPKAAPVTVDVAISDKTYSPHLVIVPVGSTVRFPNHDPFDHNVFVAADDPNGFDLGLYGRGVAKGHVFEHPGVVHVYCNVHPQMAAIVHVMATRYYTQPAVDGSFTIPRVAPGRYVLHVWHERVAAVASEDVTVGAGGLVLADTLRLDASRFHPARHKNKYGKDYPPDAGRERY